MTWAQNYDPLHSWPLSTLVAAMPVLTLFFVLLVLKARVWVAAMAGMLMAIVLARVIFGMPGIADSRVLCAGGPVRVFPDRLDHHRIDLPLRDRRRDRPVPGDEGVDRSAVIGQAAATDSGRLLLWCVPGGDWWRRCPGGHCRLVSDRARLRAFPGGDALSGRQHGARGLGRRGQPDPGPGGCYGLARSGPQRHDGPNPASTCRRSCRSGWFGAWWAGGRRWPSGRPWLVSGLSFALAQFYWSNYQESGLVDVIAALVSLLAMVAFLKIWRPATILGHDQVAAAGRQRPDSSFGRRRAPGDGRRSCLPRSSSSSRRSRRSRGS